MNFDMYDMIKIHLAGIFILKKKRETDTWGQETESWKQNVIHRSQCWENS